jgi:TATA-binding protein-associated factor Taf7
MSAADQTPASAQPGWEGSQVHPESALDTQVGGDHYKKLKIQPMEYSMANGLDACQHTAIKYITRFRDKGGVADLEKAKHCIDMLIEFERRARSSAVHSDAKTTTRCDESVHKCLASPSGEHLRSFSPANGREFCAYCFRTL